MPQWGNRDQYSDAPKFVVDDNTAETGQDQYGNTVFGVDAAEVEASNSRLTHCGWVKRTVGTGGRAGRVQEEVLVALSSRAFATGDATDFANTAAEAAPGGTADDAIYPDA